MSTGAITSYREGLARPPCASCGEPGDGGACGRCDRPLCKRHVPRDGRRCHECENVWLMRAPPHEALLGRALRWLLSLGSRNGQEVRWHLWGSAVITYVLLVAARPTWPVVITPPLLAALAYLGYIAVEEARWHRARRAFLRERHATDTALSARGRSELPAAPADARHSDADSAES